MSDLYNNDQVLNELSPLDSKFYGLLESGETFSIEYIERNLGSFFFQNKKNPQS